MKIYEIGTGYTPIPAQVPAATESVVEDLTKAFLAAKQPVEILDVSTAQRAAHNLPITEVKVPTFITKADVSLGIVHKVKRVTYSIALARKLKRILQNEPEKVVLHFHNQYNLFFFLKLVPVSLRAKALIAYTNHNGLWSLPWEECEAILHKRYFQEITAMEQADIIFVLNHRMKENVVQYLRIPAHRVIQINNGVNTDIYRPLSQDLVEQLRIDYALSGKTVILQVGSVNENKGQARSLRLLAPLLKQDPNMVFAYAGAVVSEEYQQEVLHTAEELGVQAQVKYLGTAKPGKEMNCLYNIATVTIFSSRYESFGLVCIESMAAGVPVILCTETLLDFGSGCIKLGPIPPHNQLENFLSSEDDFLRAKADARKNVLENYTWQNIAQHYLNAITNIREN